MPRQSEPFSNVDTSMFTLLGSNSNQQEQKSNGLQLSPTPMEVPAAPPGFNPSLSSPAPFSGSGVLTAEQQHLNTSSNNDREVTIRAPATLMEDFEFDALVGKSIVKVKVPRNGVKSGDFMKVTVSMDDPKEERHNVTLGRFRDGICNCCTPGQGCAHCCWTTFCISCSVAQLIRRLDVLPFGARLASCTKEQHISCYSWIAILSFVLGFAIFVLTAGQAWAGYILFLLIAAEVRRQVRKKFAIPEDPRCCKGFGFSNDIVCALFCLPCMTCQLHRQLNETEKFQTHVCSSDGLGGDQPRGWYTTVSVVNNV